MHLTLPSAARCCQLRATAATSAPGVSAQGSPLNLGTRTPTSVKFGAKLEPASQRDGYLGIPVPVETWICSTSLPLWDCRAQSAWLGIARFCNESVSPWSLGRPCICNNCHITLPTGIEHAAIRILYGLLCKHHAIRRDFQAVRSCAKQDWFDRRAVATVLW